MLWLLRCWAASWQTAEGQTRCSASAPGWSLSQSPPRWAAKRGAGGCSWQRHRSCGGATRKRGRRSGRPVQFIAAVGLGSTLCMHGVCGRQHHQAQNPELPSVQWEGQWSEALLTCLYDITAQQSERPAYEASSDAATRNLPASTVSASLLARLPAAPPQWHVWRLLTSLSICLALPLAAAVGNAGSKPPQHGARLELPN